MWMSKPETASEFLSQFELFQLLSFYQVGFKESINTLFWSSVILAIIYFYFNKFGWKFLKAQKIQYYKIQQTIQCAWNVCFHAAATFYLFIYRKYFILSRIQKESERLFPKYRNSLFLLSNYCSLFNSMSLILVTFYITSTVFDFKQRDYSEVRSKLLYICLLICLNNNGYENYFITFNLIVGAYQLCNECFMIATLHMSDSKKILINTFSILKISLWSYIYLTLLPFNYLVPTLYAKNFKLWLNVFLWFWYGSCIWNSPILQYIYHRIYHQNSNEYLEETLTSRCILVKEFPEWQHYKKLQQAFLEINLTVKQKKNGLDHMNPSATAYQTIKCVIALKRKLRRIRANRMESDSF